MLLISHRGNISGRDADQENNPSYIDAAINKGFMVEVDLRVIDGFHYLGHDYPEYRISKKYLLDRKDKLILHIKNPECIERFLLDEEMCAIEWFAHTDERFVYTSKLTKWYHSSQIVFYDGINVMPEINFHHDDLIFSMKGVPGVCSDYVARFEV